MENTKILFGAKNVLASMNIYSLGAFDDEEELKKVSEDYQKKGYHMDAISIAKDDPKHLFLVTSKKVAEDGKFHLSIKVDNYGQDLHSAYSVMNYFTERGYAATLTHWNVLKEHDLNLVGSFIW